MASIVTNRGSYLMLSGDVDLRDHVIKVVLLDSTFAPVATINTISEITSDELSGTGYTGGFAGSGRKTLANKTLTENDTDGVAIFDADNLTWTGINAGTFKTAAIVREVTTDADSPVLGLITFPTTATSGGDLLLAWSTNGIFRITTGDVSNVNVRRVTYTATGAEGTDFTVTIGGAAMASDDYEVLWAPKGVTTVPIPDLPDVVAGDRTTTTFRVVTADVLTSGDKLGFVVVQ